MGKKLIGCDNVEQYICHDEQKIYVDRSMLLSPGAKDYLSKNRIGVIYGSKSETGSVQGAGADSEQVNELASRVVNLLKKDYGIVDEQQLCEITMQVFSKLHGNTLKV